MTETKLEKQLVTGYRGYDIKYLLEFNSISEFSEYISKTPTNESFKNAKLHSNMVWNDNWAGTKTFDEAIELLKNGWSDISEKINKKISISKDKLQSDKVFKNVLSVCGYQPIVPLYLQGVPNNMVCKKQKVLKNKIITINKTLSASSAVSSERLINENIKCFQIIKRLESSGYRVNLNLLISGGLVCVKIKLKSANERLNLSKLTFPLIHTAMLRRLYFRFTEVYPRITSNFVDGYGRVPNENVFKQLCKENEILLNTSLFCSDEKELVTMSVEEIIKKLK